MKNVESVAKGVGGGAMAAACVGHEDLDGGDFLAIFEGVEGSGYGEGGVWGLTLEVGECGLECECVCGGDAHG